LKYFETIKAGNDLSGPVVQRLGGKCGAVGHTGRCGLDSSGLGSIKCVEFVD